jgi:hypothetical protein
MVNACHLILQVNTLAEITHHNGAIVLDCAFYGMIDADNSPSLHLLSKSKLNWPSQMYPPKKAGGMWRKYLLNFVHPTRALKQKLGSWNQQVYSQRLWKYVSHGTNILRTHKVQTHIFIKES